MTDSRDIQRRAVDIVSGATAAGGRVFTPATANNWDRQTYPVILVNTVKETKQSLAKGQVDFLTTTTLRFVLRSQREVTDFGDGRATAEDEAWELYRDLFTALVNNTRLWRLIQDTPSVLAQVGVNDKGEQLIGEVVAAVTFEYPQGAEDFYQPAACPIAGFDRVTD